MATSGANGFIAAVAQLIGAIVWPAVVVAVLLLFRTRLADFFGHLGSFSFSGPGGVSVSANRAVRAAAALGAATATRASASGALHETTADSRGLAAAVPGRGEQRKMQGSRVLWVDDNPGNDLFERQVFEALGMHVDTAETTEDAQRMAAQHRYDLIISDMGHPVSGHAETDPHGGYTLLARLRKDGQVAPFLIYTRPDGQEGAAEALRHGAFDYTTMPQQLLTAVTRALVRSPGS